MTDIADCIAIDFNGVQVIAFADGSIKKRDGRTSDKWIRTFGSKGCIVYMHTRLGGKMASIHRIIAKAFLHDFEESNQVDHIDGCGWNNRPENLRMVTCRGNSQAFRRKSDGKTSIYRGVSMRSDGKKWLAGAWINGARKHIGTFSSEIDAAKARDSLLRSIGYAPESLNFP